MSLEEFVIRIPDFQECSSSRKIDYFSYYLLIVDKQIGVKPSQIRECFNDLHLPPYTNISAYLTTNSKRGKKQKYLKRKEGYFLVSTLKTAIDLVLTNPELKSTEPSNDLFPMELLVETKRGYLIGTGKQAAICYDVGTYDASFVMIRKLLETLIIECFERYGEENTIKGSDGHYFFLSNLIDKFKLENSWNLGRNTVQSLPKIKALGDLSAHNRRFSAKKPDIDKIKGDLRIVLEEIIHLIDYPNWNR